MEILDGVPVFVDGSPYEKTAKLSKDLTKRHRYALKKLTNMKRDLDTFQLKKPLTDILNDINYSSRAFSENRSKQNTPHIYKIKTATSYVQDDNNRPKSEHRQRMKEGTSLLSQKNANLSTRSKEMLMSLRLEKMKQVELRNKMQDTQLFKENSYKIQMDVSKTTDHRINYRRMSESVDKQIRNEKEKILILNDQLKGIQDSREEEISKYEELEQHNLETNKRILEKRRQKKDLEDQLKEQEAVLKHLSLKIDDLVFKEQECLTIIKRFEREASHSITNPTPHK
jgi:chromosome segregation ATPase